MRPRWARWLWSHRHLSCGGCAGPDGTATRRRRIVTAITRASGGATFKLPRLSARTFDCVVHHEEDILGDRVDRRASMFRVVGRSCMSRGAQVSQWLTSFLEVPL